MVMELWLLLMKDLSDLSQSAYLTEGRRLSDVPRGVTEIWKVRGKVERGLTNRSPILRALYSSGVEALVRKI